MKLREVDAPWSVSSALYVEAHGARADYSPAALAIRDEWRRGVLAAFDAQRITLHTPDLHADAAGIIRSELLARDKIAREAHRSMLREQAQLFSIDTIQVGEKLWHSGLKTRVLVVRKNLVSVDVRGDRGMLRVNVAEGRLWRQSPDEIEAAVKVFGREATGLPKAPAGAAVSAAVPDSGEAPAGSLVTGTREWERAPHNDIAEHGRSSAAALAHPGANRHTVASGGFIPRSESDDGAAAEAGGTGGSHAHDSAVSVVSAPVPPGRGLDHVPERLDLNFEGRRMPAVFIRGQWWWPARHVGREIGQGDDGKRFVRNVTEGDGAEGVDFIRVEGDDLVHVRATLAAASQEPVDAALKGWTQSAPLSEPLDSSSDSHGRAMVLLSESGLNLALMRSRTEIGKRMRVWLARDVIPSIRRTGSYSRDTTPAASIPMDAVSQIIEATVKACMEAMRPRRRAAKPRAIPGGTP